MHENAMRIVSILQAMLTPTIGLVTLYIAWRQHESSRTKLALDRYEKRLSVYKAVRAYLAEIVSTAKVETDSIRRLRIDTSEATFLFSRDIPDYINELVKHGIALGTANASYRDINTPDPTPLRYDHSLVTKTMHDELLWFSDQFEIAEIKFGKYLNVA